MHNTFDIIESNGLFIAKSHNFPNVEGVGTSEKQALSELNRKCQYIIDNDKPYYKKLLKQRKDLGVICLCGYNGED